MDRNSVNHDEISVINQRAILWAAVTAMQGRDQPINTLLTRNHLRPLLVKIQERRFGRRRRLFLCQILAIRLHLRQIFPVNQCPIAMLKRLFNHRAAIGRAGGFAISLPAAFAGHGTAVAIRRASYSLNMTLTSTFAGPFGVIAPVGGQFARPAFQFHVYTLTFDGNGQHPAGSSLTIFRRRALVFSVARLFDFQVQGHDTRRNLCPVVRWSSGLAKNLPMV